MILQIQYRKLCSTQGKESVTCPQNTRFTKRMLDFILKKNFAPVKYYTVYSQLSGVIVERWVNR